MKSEVKKDMREMERDVVFTNGGPSHDPYGPYVGEGWGGGVD